MLGEKRMFSRKVVESDAFLDMTAGAQLLYFHLCMNADDEGFVSAPKRIMRMVGLAEETLEELRMKRFILSFDSGVIVVKHWRMNNVLRKDRSQPTDYTEEKAQLYLKENGSYTLDGNKGNRLSTVCQPLDNHLTTTCQPFDAIKEKKRKEKKTKEDKRKEGAGGETTQPYDFSAILQNISRKVNDDAE